MQQQDLHLASQSLVDEVSYNEYIFPLRKANFSDIFCQEKVLVKKAKRV